MKNAVYLYVTDCGHQFRIPDRMYHAARWTKDGLLDKRYAGNDEMAAYIALQEIADAEGIEEYQQ